MIRILRKYWYVGILPFGLAVQCHIPEEKTVVAVPARIGSIQQVDWEGDRDGLACD
jgi:hypothetical protein